jgi:hypothetical protein
MRYRKKDLLHLKLHPTKNGKKAKAKAKAQASRGLYRAWNGSMAIFKDEIVIR